ncbi:MAG: hypothetical protein DRP12_00235 [Candidatus Aenigmatarchaeota archaeon]|nr:MAG: hypothetical protein DRP12_00235 [Candidatus Aenigmarchaeota archaeon]
MPRHEVHRMVAKAVLGKAYPEVDRFLDWPYKILGPRHRVLFHDLKTTPAMVTLLTGDVRKGMAAAVHILLDKTFSKRTR